MARPAPRYVCPVQGCNRKYASPAATGGHMRKEHNVYGGLSGRTRPDLLSGPVRVPTKDLVLRLPENGPVAEPMAKRIFWAPEGLELLTDGDDLYLVQRIPR